MSQKKIASYYAKKAGIFVLSLLVLSILVFYVSRLAPGDPLLSYYGERVEKMKQQERFLAQERLGLNQPVHIQYVRWFVRAVQGDFGISYKYKKDVLEVISGRVGNTLLLGGLGFVLIFLFALLLGIFCAFREGSLLDRIICRIGTITSAVPVFWISLLLILIFSVKLHWLPSSGAYTIGSENKIGDRIAHLILPLSIVVMEHLWYYAYLVRNKLLEEVRAEYVLLAKSKGLGRRKIIFGHCLRNIVPAYIGIMAISVPHVMGGTYIVEMVFSYPGIGRLSYESARFHDYNLLMVLCILSGAAVILFSMAAQMVNERIDPRMRASKMVQTTEVIRDGQESI